MNFSKYIYSPEAEWNYSIWVVMKDELWHEITELWASNIIVTKPELNASEETIVETNQEENIQETEKDLTITWIKVIELKSKSILTWDEIEWIESYNVYKKIDDDNYEFITEVSEPRFEIEFDWDDVKYDYFAIKAVDKNEEWFTYEWDLSQATKVKTWPEILILILISLFIGSLLFLTKAKKA